MRWGRARTIDWPQSAEDAERDDLPVPFPPTTSRCCCNNEKGQTEVSAMASFRSEEGKMLTPGLT